MESFKAKPPKVTACLPKTILIRKIYTEAMKVKVLEMGSRTPRNR